MWKSQIKPDLSFSNGYFIGSKKYLSLKDMTLCIKSVILDRKSINLKYNCKLFEILSNTLSECSNMLKLKHKNNCRKYKNTLTTVPFHACYTQIRVKKLICKQYNVFSSIK